MSKFNYTLHRLCGTVHTGGNLEYVNDHTIVSVVGNRVTEVRAP